MEKSHPDNEVTPKHQKLNHLITRFSLLNKPNLTMFNISKPEE
jgi:hypothetical protein